MRAGIPFFHDFFIEIFSAWPIHIYSQPFFRISIRYSFIFFLFPNAEPEKKPPVIHIMNTNHATRSRVLKHFFAEITIGSAYKLSPFVWSRKLRRRPEISFRFENNATPRQTHLSSETKAIPAKSF